MAAQRIWMARDCGYTSDPKVQALGDEFGAEGPLVVEEVFALAKLAEQHECLIVHYGVLARRAFTTPVRVRKIVDAAFELGLLELVERPSLKGVVLTLPRYTRWQVKDPSNAARQARHRNAKVTPEVTEPSVTKDRYVTQSNGGTVDSRQTTTSGNTSTAVVAPEAAAVLPPALADVMAIAQEAAGHRDTLNISAEAIALQLRNYPHANHLRAAHDAASDYMAGAVNTDLFHKWLGVKLAHQRPDQPDRRSERERREAEDVAALRALREAQA